MLNNTGTACGLTVTGTGAAGTGGTIQTATGDGVSLTSANKTSLAWMNISSTGAGGVIGNLFNFLGHSTANMTLIVTSGTVTGNAPSTATTISAVNQGASHTVNVSGATFTNNNAGIDCSTDAIATTLRGMRSPTSPGRLGTASSCA